MKKNKPQTLFFDANLYSTCKEVEDAIAYLKNEIRSLPGIVKCRVPNRSLLYIPPQPTVETVRIERWNQRYTDHLRLIVLNLFNAYLHNSAMNISYWRAKEGYKPNRYHATQLRHDSMLLMIDALGFANLNYIDDSHLGSKKKLEVSRMLATPKFIDLLVNRFKLTSAMIQRHPDEDLIVMKETVKVEWKIDKDGSREKRKKTVKVDYQETADTQRMRKNLRKINNFIKKHFIGMCLNDKDVESLQVSQHKAGKERIDFSKTTLRRSFSNRDFNQGGRLYGPFWQNIPSAFRKYIRIDNKMTYEFDFKCYQAKLLYAEAGLPIPPGDLYMLPGFPKEERKFLKTSFQVLMNTPSRRSATMKISSLIKDDPILQGKYKADDIVEAILQQHQSIQEHFFTGNKGLLLQRVDSDITEKILLRLVDRGVVCLAIHDSFVVRRDHVQTLVVTMKSVLLDRYGYEIEIEQDDTAFDAYLEVWDRDEGEVFGEEFYERQLVDRDLCSQYFVRLKAWEDLHGPCPA